MITVALPVYNSSKIAWLAMEGLCRQQCSYPWELLICEEDHPGKCGKEFFLSYSDRLTGCINIDYIIPPERITLAQKWAILARTARGEYFVLQAADCYSDAGRLDRVVEQLKDADWTHNKKGHFYQLSSRTLVLFISGGRTGLNMAVRTNAIRDLPDSTRNRGVDNYLFSHILAKGNMRINSCQDDPGSLDTDGLNNISTGRYKMINQVRKPMFPPEKTLEEILPAELIERLTNLL